MSTHGGGETSAESERPRHAGFWVRSAAALLDMLIMGVPVILLVSVIFGSDASEITGFDLRYTDPEGETVTNRISFSLADLMQLLVLAVITVLLWVNWDGRTPGKKITRTRIVSYPGYQPLSYATSTVRMLVAAASAIPLAIGYAIIALMVGLRDDKRGYHDLIAGTCVIHDA